MSRLSFPHAVVKNHAPFAETLGHAAVRGGIEKHVETLATEEKCQCWNLAADDGDTPIMLALKDRKTEIVEILIRCPRVDLSCRDEEGWSLVFRAIQYKSLGEKMLKYFVY